MKQLFTLLTLSGILSQALPAQTLTFSRLYGGTAYDDARGLARADQCCFVFTGLSNSGTDIAGDMYLTKINAAGATIWSKYYGRKEEDGGNYVLRTSDNGFLIIGHTALSYGELCDGYIVKTDADGNEKWRSFVGTAYDDVCDSGIEMPDGSFFLTGRVENAETRSFRVMLAKLTASGTGVFLRELETPLPSLGFRIALASDGDLLIAGYSIKPDNHETDMLVLKCSQNGSVRWHQNVGTAFDDRALALLPTPDGGCIAVGSTGQGSNDTKGMAVYQFDKNGAILAHTDNVAAPETGYIADVQYDDKGKIVIAGVLDANESGLGKSFTATLGDDWQFESLKKIDLPAQTQVKSMLLDQWGNPVVCGKEKTENSADGFVARTAAPLNTANVLEYEAAPFMLFPNPFRDYTYLKVGAPNQPKTLIITTMDGAVVRKTTFDDSELIIRREGMLAGQYVFSVYDQAGKTLVSGKLSAQ